MIMIRRRECSDPIDRFMKKVKKTRYCWIWLGRVNHNGYGRFNLGRSEDGQAFAHRYSHEIFNGAFDKSLYVLHKCDNSLCVNPKHLYAGTAKDNIDDMWIRLRKKTKVSPLQVYQIRALHKTGFFNYADISRFYKINKSYVRFIVKRFSWKHLK